MTETGNSEIISCPTPTSCSTSYAPINSKSDVKIKDSDKFNFYVDDDKWDKEGKNVSFHSVFFRNYSPGSNETFTVDYSGIIKNKSLVEGTFTINSVYHSSSIIYQYSAGNFTIKRKK